MSKDVRLTRLSSCAGCGAKVGAGTLSKILGNLPVHPDERLLVGYDTSDDCCVYQVSDELAIVQTVDFFPPIVDDPYTFGKIAAANALSDVFAMGAEPKLAMNILCVSRRMDNEDIQDLLRGGYEKVYEAGAVIAGGHTIFGEEPKYGLSVTGFVRSDRYLRNCAARPGDALILTKPLGTGILTTAARGGMAEPEQLQRAVESMCLLNKAARDTMVEFPVHSCTDVTGFGLLGHSYEMAAGSGVTLELEYSKIPRLPGVYELAQMGILPEGMYRNRDFAEAGTLASPGVDTAMLDVLFDPQTSGGLLIAVEGDSADKLLRQLKNVIPCAEIIGKVLPQGEKEIIVRC